MPSDRVDIYQKITDQVIQQLSNGVTPWHQPWSGEHAAGRIIRPLRHSGEPYKGVNIIVLWMTAEAKGYSNPIWMTFKQAATLQGQIRKGEKSTLVTYADKLKRKDEDTGEEKEIFYQKAYPVFNVEQIDNLPAHYYALAELPKLNPMERDEAAEAFIKNTGAIINHGGNRAYYTEAHDRIQMPPYETFETPPAYLGTVFHELGHWSKHPSRLNRDFGRKRWGDEGYAMDELVSELNAAYLCADLGIEPTPAPDHAAYIQSWLKVLQGDKRAIFQAAGHAQRAADFLHSLQPAIKSPSPALSEAPATPLELPELPSAPEPAAPPLALVVDRPEKPRGFVEKERKRRAAKKVTGQTELF